MNLADILVFGVSGVLVAYFVLVYLAYRKTRNVVMLAIFVLTAYWTLVGALPVLFAKREASGVSTSYIEGKLFLILVDGDYALTLACYAVFMVIVVTGYLIFSRPADPTGEDVRSFARLAGRFSHIALVTMVALVTIPKLYVVNWLVQHAPDGTSLYQATRLVIGDNAEYIRAYQYFNIITSYSIGCGALLWVAFKESRERYEREPRALVWVAYIGLAGIMLGENLLLGNRAIPLTVMVAWALGWWGWRYRPAPRREKRKLRRRFLELSVVGLVVIGLIGSSRGRASVSLETVLESAWENLLAGGGIVEQLTNSVERLSAHMALYGVIKQPLLVKQPLVNSTYAAYAELLNAPSDQNFTIHSVAAWWLRVGPIGVLLSAVVFAMVLVFLQRFAFSAHRPMLGAFAIPAATLPAMGAPVLMLRSGPESLRGLIFELIFIPGVLCLIALVIGERYTRRRTTHRPQPRVSTPGEIMNQSATTDVTRAFAAIMRRWWVIVLAAALGAALGIISTLGGSTVTYEATVSAVPIAESDALGSVSAGAKAPIARMVADLQSPATKAELGGAVADSALAVTVTGNTVSIRVTAATEAQAKKAAEAYSAWFVEQYRANNVKVLEMAKASLDEIITGLKALVATGSPEATKELQIYSMRRAQIVQLIEAPAPDPSIKKLSSGNPMAGTSILLAVALAALTAGVIGLAALFDRRLRFAGEVEAITGAGTVLGETGGQSQWQLTNVLGRLAKRGGELQVLSLSTPSAEVGAELTKLGATVIQAGDEEQPAPGPVVVLAQLGKDSRSALASAYQTLTIADGPFAGVIVTKGR